jgi:ribosomal protein S18 acetylase RimI-like enzyme
MTVVRPMTEADIVEVIDMWVATWQAAYPAIDFEARRGWIEDRLAELEQTGSQPFVAVADGAVAGLVTVNFATGYLDQFAVATDMQGKGIASKLLAQARSLTQTLELHVNRDNDRAIAFYKKHGFSVAGESINPHSGAPIYLMRWERS